MLTLVFAADPTGATTNTSLGEGGGEGSGAFTGLSQAPEANLFTGAMSMSVPILVPPGRKHVTPALELSYSSMGGHSIFGHGWQLPLGSIERSSKHGVPGCVTDGSTLDHSQEFVAVMAGGSLELQHISGDLYRAKYDEAYMEATADTINNRWTLTDRRGMTYRFGWTSEDRLFKGEDVFMWLGSGACRYTSIWALTQIEDPHGNTIDIQYVKHGETLYPSTIQYGGNLTRGVEHPFQVEFLREARPYPVRSYRLGIAQDMTQRIHRIEVGYRQATIFTEYELVRGYDLSYEDVAEGGRSLLTAVAGDLLPAQSFEYSKSTFHHQTLPDWPPSGSWDFRLRYRASSQSVRRSLMDMNGDGMTDWIKTEGTGSGNVWYVYLGTPNGLSTNHITWTSPLSGTHMNDLSTDENNVRVKYETVDLTGDGIPDFVDARQEPWKVYPGSCSSATSCGFASSPIHWNAPETHISRNRNLNGNSTWVTVKTLLDMNGDGRPDLVLAGPDSDDPFDVYLNTGSRFTLWEDFQATGSLTRVYHALGSASGLTVKDLFDWNGDGLPDRITANLGAVARLNPDGSIQSILSDDCSHPYKVCSNQSGPIAELLSVELNTGTGFASAFNVPVSTANGNDYFGVRLRLSHETLEDFVDVNGDGLTDRVEAPGSGSWKVLLNQGERLKVTVNAGSVEGDTWAGIGGPLRETNGSGSTVTLVDVLDWNGDGFLDRVKWDGSASKYQIRVGAPTEGPHLKPSLLIKAHNGLGGVTEVRYAASSELDNTGEEDDVPDLPFHLWVTTGIRHNDGLCDPPVGVDTFDPAQNPCIDAGHESLQWLDYEGGRYDSVSREFRGFRRVTQSDVDGNSRDIIFSQSEESRGKVELDVQYVGSEKLLEDEYLWTTQNSLGRTQLYLAEHKMTEFSTVDPGLDQCKLTRNEPPDDYGRITTTCSIPWTCGASTPSDCSNPVEGQVITRTDWANPNAGFHVRERPSRILTEYKNDQGALETLVEKWFRYDGGATPLEEGEVERGDVRSVESYLDQSFAGPANNPVVLTHYDPLGNPLEVTDPNGRTSVSHYNESFFYLYPDWIQAPSAGGVVQRVYTTTDLRYGKPASVLDENGQLSKVEYDGLGRTICESQLGVQAGTPCSDAFRVEYDYVYGIPGATDSMARLTYVESRRVEPDAPDGYLTSRIYSDGMGRDRFQRTQMVIGSDPELQGVILKQRDFDAKGRVVVSYAPYLAAPDGSAAFPPSSDTTNVDYHLNGGADLDPLSRAHIVTPPSGDSQLTFYEGKQTRIIDALGNESRRIQDAFGRVVRKELYDQTNLEMWFDYEYDGMGRPLVTTISDDEATRTTQAYDTLGRRIELDDQDSGVWRFGYDANGNQIYENDPSMGEPENPGDPAPGQHVQMLYDELNRITKRCLFNDGEDYVPLVNDCGSGTEESSYSYDSTEDGNFGIGRLTSVTDLTGSESFVYDERGRVVGQTKIVLGLESKMVFSYNDADRPTEIDYPDSETTSYTYNQAGQPYAIEANAGLNYLDAIEYDLFGRAERIEHANGIVDKRVFYDGEENFRVQDIKTIKPGEAGNEFLLDLRYRYTDIGKIRRIVDNRDTDTIGIRALSNDASYTYDGIGRLIRVNWLPNGVGDEYDNEFDYDAIGNITEKDGQFFSYDGAGPHWATGFGSKSMLYDDNGRRTQKSAAGKSQTYEYDELDRLTKIVVDENGEQSVVEQQYDYQGQRVVKIVNGGSPIRYFGRYTEARNNKLIKYYYAGDLLIASKTPKNPHFESQVVAWRLPPEMLGGITLLIVVLLFAPGRREIRLGVAVAPSRAFGTAMLVFATCLPLATLGCNGKQVIRHYHRDHLGTTQALTNQHGDLIVQTRYRAYGEVRGRFNVGGAEIHPYEDRRHEFTGYETELESGLQYAGSRFYDPELAQFLTLDPKFQFASPYAYGPGDPLNGTDPDGEFFLSLLVLVILTFAVTFATTYAETGDAKLALKQAALSAGIAAGAFVAGAIAGPVAATAFGEAAGPVAASLVSTSVKLAATELTSGAVQEASESNLAITFARVGVYAAYGATLASRDATSSEVSGENQEAHELARQQLRKYNKISVETDAEYGGLIYQNPDGTLGATAPVRSPCYGIGACGLNLGDADLPLDASIVLDWHTHGRAPDTNPMRWERFSSADVASTNQLGGTNTVYEGSYLGTPEGRVYFLRPDTINSHDWSERSIRQVQEYRGKIPK